MFDNIYILRSSIMVTWKEPPVVRQHNKNYSQHVPPYLLRRKTYELLFLLVLTPLITAGIFDFPFANRTQQQQFINLTLILWGAGVVAYAIGMAILILTRPLEATYRLDNKGIKTRRSLYSDTIRWPFVRSLEIVPHPTIENISLLKIAFLDDYFKIRTEEIPFERDRINVALIMELYDRRGPIKYFRRNSSR